MAITINIELQHCEITHTFFIEAIKNCMMLQKESLLRFCLDNLLSISGSKLYIGLFPVTMPEDHIKHLSTFKNVMSRIIAVTYLQKRKL